MTTADDMLWRAASSPLTIGDLPEDAEGVRLELNDGSLSVTPLGDADHQELVLASAMLHPVIPFGLRAYPGINVIRDEEPPVMPGVAVTDPSFLTKDRRESAPRGFASSWRSRPPVLGAVT